MADLRPAPNICARCPWRVSVTPAPEQLAIVREAVRTGNPQACTDRRHADRVCLPWIAACGADSPAVVQAVVTGGLQVEALGRRTNWPAVHDSPGAVIAAVYRTARRRVDPLVIALREAREAAGMSQRDLAQRLGVSDAVVRDVETGRTQSSLARVRAIADAVGVDLAVVTRRR